MQVTVSRSSAEAEYRAVAHAVAETVWLRQLLSELHRPIEKATIVYCDNISAVYMSGNLVQHRIEIDIHFVREKVALGQVRVLHVPTSAQFADIFTKGLATTPFQDIRFSLNVVEPTVDTAGGCQNTTCIRIETPTRFVIRLGQVRLNSYIYLLKWHNIE